MGRASRSPACSTTGPTGRIRRRGLSTTTASCRTRRATSTGTRWRGGWPTPRFDPLGYPERSPPLPLLLLHGEADGWNPVTTSQRLHAALTGPYRTRAEALRLVVVPGAPHWPPGAAFVAETVEWLTRW